MLGVCGPKLLNPEVGNRVDDVMHPQPYHNWLINILLHVGTPHLPPYIPTSLLCIGLL